MRAGAFKTQNLLGKWRPNCKQHLTGLPGGTREPQGAEGRPKDIQRRAKGTPNDGQRELKRANGYLGGLEKIYPR